MPPPPGEFPFMQTTPAAARRRPWPFSRILPLILLLLCGGVFFAAARPEPLLILTYHRVSAGPPGPVPSVTPRDFARQLDYLARTGYRSISPDELARWLQARQQLPRPAVLITFDDGWCDNYTLAGPLLRARNFTATVFVVSGRVGRPGCLTASQLRAMAATGWTIGAHTVTHPHLPSLDPATAAAEISTSRAALARLLGCPVTAFAYPYGDCDGTIRVQVGQAGFATAFGTRLGLPRPGQDPLAIARLTMPRRGGLILLHMAVSPWFGLCRRLLDRAARTVPALRLQEAYSRQLWQRHPCPPARYPRFSPLQ